MNQALCDDCSKPLTAFELNDYVDKKNKYHTVCPKCLTKWIGIVGYEEAKYLLIKKRKNSIAEISNE